MPAPQVVRDALQAARNRQSKRARETGKTSKADKRLVLTTDDLATALRPFGTHLVVPSFHEGADGEKERREAAAAGNGKGVGRKRKRRG